MKTALITVGIILAGIAAVFYIMKSDGNIYTETVIIIDKTDTLLLPPEKEQIFSAAGIDGHKWKGFKFQLSTITNVDFNPMFTYSIPAKNVVISSPVRRDSAIRKIKQEVADRLDSLTLGQTGKNASSIYRPLVTELNRLAKSPAQHKIALYYGDAHQNTLEFSAYEVEDIEKLSTNKEEVIALLHKQVKPGNYAGMKVYFLCRTDEKTNHGYLLMTGLFREILEHAGAEVFVGTNLNSF